MWLATGAGLFVSLSLLAILSDGFGYDVDVIDMPITALVAILMIAGAVFVCLPRLLRRSTEHGGINPVYLVTWIIVTGLAMRLVFLGTQPVLEDDYNRYLLDGAVTAHGYNPYSHSPLAIAEMTTDDAVLRQISQDAGVVMERINYPQIRTVYPPVAQFAFALAHWIKPWSLDAWRMVILGCDAAVLGLIVLLLREVGRPVAWMALYWWNPVVVKELYNSTHMDVLVVLPMLAALWFAIRQRPMSTAVAVAVGIGAKIWPVLLLPTVFRAWLRFPRIMIPAMVATAALSAALLSPVVISGLNDSSGFVAYGSRWQANDALFQIVLWGCRLVAELAGLAPEAGKLMARALVFAVLCCFVLALNRHPPASPSETCRRVFLTVAALLLLSPTQFPWYYTWLAVFLPLFPLRGFLVLAVTMPLYYAYFHLVARGQEHLFDYAVVFLIWLPVWALLLTDLVRHRNERRSDECGNVQ